MKIKKYFLYVLSVLLSGCVITNTPGFFSGYKKLTNSQKQSIVFIDDTTSICAINNDQRIYSITATHLLNCLKNNETSIVYFWSPNCHSKSCISLSAAEQYCIEKKYTLYIITEYYDLEKTKAQNNSSRPILSVNHKYYKTDYCNKYMKLFTNELIHDKTLSSEDLNNRFFVFKADSLIRTQIELSF
jgi:hypothetical protein